MMNAALVLAGLAMGVAASPHCLAMCGAPCAALTSACKSQAGGFHIGRLLGYTAGGAAAASSVIALGTWSQAAPALRPVWTLMHLGLLLLGLWWLSTGRAPTWMQRNAAVTIHVVSPRHHQKKIVQSSLIGLAWVAWPCAALQAALLLAALASSPLGGGLVMAAFALGSMPALAFAPWLRARWRKYQQTRQQTRQQKSQPTRLVSDARVLSSEHVAMLGFRVAGLGLVLASGWALTHGLWLKVAAWCGI